MLQWFVTTRSCTYSDAGHTHQLTQGGRIEAKLLSDCIREKIRTRSVLVLYSPREIVQHDGARETAYVIADTFGIARREVYPLPPELGQDKLEELADWICNRAQEFEAVIVVTSEMAAPALIHKASLKMLGQSFEDVRSILHRGQAHLLGMRSGGYEFLNPYQSGTSRAADF